MIRVDKQFSIFLDNRPGTLSRTCQALAKAGINIIAFSVLDTIDHAIIRMVVDKPKEAEPVLARLQGTVQQRDVVFMDVPHQVGALAAIAEKLGQAGINIEYAYCTAPSTPAGGALVLRTNDLEATINALS